MDDRDKERSLINIVEAQKNLQKPLINLHRLN